MKKIILALLVLNNIFILNVYAEPELLNNNAIIDPEEPHIVEPSYDDSNLNEPSYEESNVVEPSDEEFNLVDNDPIIEEKELYEENPYESEDSLRNYNKDRKRRGSSNY